MLPKVYLTLSNSQQYSRKLWRFQKIVPDKDSLLFFTEKTFEKVLIYEDIDNYIEQVSFTESIFFSLAENSISNLVESNQI